MIDYQADHVAGPSFCHSDKLLRTGCIVFVGGHLLEMLQDGCHLMETSLFKDKDSLQELEKNDN